MDGHGCRHVAWAVGSHISVGFFHPFWTINYSRCYGRKEFHQYTQAMDQRLARGIKGVSARDWDIVPIGEVYNADNQEEHHAAIAMMNSVYSSDGPVVVTQKGDLIFNTNEFGVQDGWRSFDFVSGNIRQRLQDQVFCDVDAFDEDTNERQQSNDNVSQVSNPSTVAYNDIKAGGAVVAGYVHADNSMYQYTTKEFAEFKKKCMLEFHRRHPQNTPARAKAIAFNPVQNIRFSNVPRGDKHHL